MSYHVKLKKLTAEQQEIAKRYDEEKQKEIQKLEEKRTKLVEKRQLEVLKLITDTGALDIDNQILSSVLLFLKNPANQTHPFIEELLQAAQIKRKPKTKQAQPQDNTTTNKHKHNMANVGDTAKS